MKKNIRLIETQIQNAIFHWAALNEKKYPELQLLYASMNGIKLDSPYAGYCAKKAGLKAGIPDICLPVARHGYHGLYIELKRDENKKLLIKKGKVSPQQEYILQLLNKEDYLALVCYGFDETIKTIRDYLG